MFTITKRCIDGWYYSVCIYNEENPTEFCTTFYINLLI